MIQSLIASLIKILRTRSPIKRKAAKIMKTAIPVPHRILSAGSFTCIRFKVRCRQKPKPRRKGDMIYSNFLLILS